VPWFGEERCDGLCKSGGLIVVDRVAGFELDQFAIGMLLGHLLEIVTRGGPGLAATDEQGGRDNLLPVVAPFALNGGL